LKESSLSQIFKKLPEETPDDYKCGTCSQKLPDEPKCFKEESVACEMCFKWLHFVCVNIKTKE